MSRVYSCFNVLNTPKSLKWSHPYVQGCYHCRWWDFQYQHFNATFHKQELFITHDEYILNQHRGESLNSENPAMFQLLCCSLRQRSCLDEGNSILLKIPGPAFLRDSISCFTQNTFINCEYKPSKNFTCQNIMYEFLSTMFIKKSWRKTVE